ncbi:hypothetical protein LXL04_012838 [Taraxacum kok-saghyz]
MAAFDHVQNMHDIALKPRLLRSLIKEHIPDEKHQLGNPLELSQLVSSIKTHELLSERVVQTGDNKKLVEKWKSAVDLWIDRLLMLVSSNMPDKCWAGICLLGVTCEECSPERFLSSYSAWFQKLLSHLQPLAESHFVKVACCVSISDILTRLSGFPNMKKDGTSHAARVIQPLLKLMQEDNSSDAEGAVRLLSTILNSFPSSLQKFYDSVESAIVTKLIYGKCNPNMLKKLAVCLSLLPKSKGDEDSWSVLFQKLLIAINILLNDSFQGLEEDTKGSETMRVLVPPGKDPPTPLGGLTVFDFSNKSTEQRLSMSNISTLMLCCSKMITTSYPVQVKIPIQPLLMVAERVLNVDGSLAQTMYPTITAMQQEYVCTQLPFLHSYSLDILSDIVKEAHSQLLMHAAHMIRIVTDYLGKCELPELRIKLYSLIKVMLLSMGVGMSIYISEDVVSNASIDLDSVSNHGDDMNKKRKHENQSQIINPRRIPITVKIAALEALESLLTVGGALRSEKWRSDVDQLLMTVATDACKNGWTKQGNDIFTLGDTLSWGDFQLASLRALLPSLLSPGRIRPPYLSQALDLYRSGMKETGTKLAEFCAHALLTLEVLIHPRALPLIDYGSNFEYPVNGVKNNVYSSAQNGNVVTGGSSKKGESEEDDDLYHEWVKENGNDLEKKTTENVGSIEAPINVPEDKGKEILVETQSVEENVNVLENMDIDLAAAAAAVVAEFVSGGGDVAAIGETQGGGEFMFGLGDDKDGMDEIPDIVDVEPDTDED